MTVYLYNIYLYSVRLEYTNIPLRIKSGSTPPLYRIHKPDQNGTVE
jgi:hypothetical protein